MYIIHKLCPPASTSRYTSQYVTLCISLRHALYLSTSRYASQYVTLSHYVTLCISLRHVSCLSATRFVSQYVKLRVSARHDVPLQSVAGLED